MGFDLPPEDSEVQEKAEEDMFSQMAAKSSVKLKYTTRGITWEIKVVTGEEKIIPGLIKTAIQGHKDMLAELQDEKPNA